MQAGTGVNVRRQNTILSTTAATVAELSVNRRVLVRVSSATHWSVTVHTQCCVRLLWFRGSLLHTLVVFFVNLLFCYITLCWLFSALEHCLFSLCTTAYNYCKLLYFDVTF